MSKLYFVNVDYNNGCRIMVFVMVTCNRISSNGICCGFVDV